MVDSKKASFSALGFPYPLYVVDVLDRNSLVVAGGGGAVKTGVPNRIDIVNLYRNSHGAPTPIDIQQSGGLDTGTEAVMSLTVVNPGDGGFIASLEGQKCVEYIAQTKVNPITLPAKLSDVENHTSTIDGLKEISLRHRSGMPTCVTHGGPAGSWLAIGSDNGSVFLINRHTQQNCLDEKQISDSRLYQSLVLYPDVSGGLSTGVSSMAFSHPYVCKQSDPSFPLLATICDRPDWGTLRVWCTTNDALYTQSFLHLNDVKSTRCTLNPRQQTKLKSTSKRTSSNERGIRLKTFISNSDNDSSFKIRDQMLFSHSVEKYPYAIASCSTLSFGNTPPPSPNVSIPASTSSKVSERSSDRSNYRFRHCQFMKYFFRSPVPSDQSSSCGILKSNEGHTVEYMLVTTLQPLCANRRSFSRLIVWSVPHPSNISSEASSNNVKVHQPIQLKTFSEITLPQGHLPACLAVHPSRSRGLIAVGTMEGRVDVLSPSNHSLMNIYTLNNAHPIFVTALTFLREDSCVLSRKTSKAIPLKSDSFELVSVSVDRLIKWHHGPTYSTVSKLSHGIINANNTIGNISLLKVIINPKFYIYLLWLFIILLLPILVVFLEVVLSSF
ncbi:prolactin regulatory element-binding [Schistosoma japonicum]|nr:prolactin regulatory element-binding [Schistosoma japonicum]